jgi:hypothetical protein
VARLALLPNCARIPFTESRPIDQSEPGLCTFPRHYAHVNKHWLRYNLKNKQTLAYNQPKQISICLSDTMCMCLFVRPEIALAASVEIGLSE